MEQCSGVERNPVVWSIRHREDHRRPSGACNSASSPPRPLDKDRTGEQMDSEVAGDKERSAGRAGPRPQGVFRVSDAVLSATAKVLRLVIFYP